MANKKVTPKYLGTINPQNGGCWYCYFKTEIMSFSIEFDTYLHLTCLALWASLHDDDEEALIMLKEFDML